MPHDHVVIWIDHHEAHVQGFTQEQSDRVVIKTHGEPRKLHRRSGTLGSGKAPEDHEFFERVAQAFADVREVLVVGPAQAKLEFVKYLEHHHPQLAKKIIGVETVDHPTDGQMLEHARRFFRAADRMLTQPGTHRT